MVNGGIDVIDISQEVSQESTPNNPGTIGGIPLIMSPPLPNSDQDMKDLAKAAVKSLTHVMQNKVLEVMNVRSRHKYVPGLSTTMIYPRKIKENTVSSEEPPRPSNGDITLEIKLEMSTLRRLQPGARVTLEVSGITSATGDALNTDAENRICKEGLYNFMSEGYDADEDSEQEWDEDAETCNNTNWNDQE